MSQNVHCVSHIGAGLPPERGVRSAALVGCIRFLHGTDLILFGVQCAGAGALKRNAPPGDGFGLLVPPLILSQITTRRWSREE